MQCGAQGLAIVPLTRAPMIAVEKSALARKAAQTFAAARDLACAVSHALPASQPRQSGLIQERHLPVPTVGIWQ
jgi:hypothetical protein